MGIISNLFGVGNTARSIGQAVKETSEVFHVNETDEMREDAKNFQASLSQFEKEFENDSTSVFGQTVDGLNRLPRPMMAIGTIFLFGFALYDPSRFSVRMEGLQTVPEPLWWLIGAIVSFYFGARELHYMRVQKTPKSAPPKVSAKKATLPHEEIIAQSQNARLKKPRGEAPNVPPSSVQSAKVKAAEHTMQQTGILRPKASDNPAIQAWIDETRNR